MSIGDGLKRLASERKVRRPHQVGLHLSDAENTIIRNAAELSGAKVTAWLVETGLAAAEKLTVPDDAEYRFVWADGQITYHAAESLDMTVASFDGELDGLEPGESITITRIRKG
jgi:uncharacterized protein (DUF1778 family)